MHPEPNSKALDRRRCFLCAEPVTEIICPRCGHIQQIEDHPVAATIMAYARQSAATTRWLAKHWRQRDGSGRESGTGGQE